MKKNNMVCVNNFSLALGDFHLNQICLDIEEGEIFAILGPTGAGKTVLLESIAGIYEGEKGVVFLDGKRVCDSAPNKRDLAFVYQDYALFPHMTVMENIKFGLKMKKIDKNKGNERINELITLLKIEHLMNRYPANLSGGEKQRVALARALVLNPKLLLMDEPFSALDPKTKEQMYQLIKKIHEAFGCTIIFITHDFNEAQRLAFRIGILIGGSIRGVCESQALFHGNMEKDVEDFLIRKEINMKMVSNLN
ncbi:ABC transporter ATP-binding protein [Anaerovorax odorimutans]|uniref:ABC transporter ATP-binding protein n=1 Tax=Anaerovorax odorimutans TaxID=109327 RepID=UPI0004231545|nr:ATP-binding cassette domain-containing protein [Anaerovorax odorimutans]